MIPTNHPQTHTQQQPIHPISQHNPSHTHTHPSIDPCVDKTSMTNAYKTDFRFDYDKQQEGVRQDCQGNSYNVKIIGINDIESQGNQQVSMIQYEELNRETLREKQGEVQPQYKLQERFKKYHHSYQQFVNNNIQLGSKISHSNVIGWNSPVSNPNSDNYNNTHSKTANTNINPDAEHPTTDKTNKKNLNNPNNTIDLELQPWSQNNYQITYFQNNTQRTNINNKSDKNSIIHNYHTFHRGQQKSNTLSNSSSKNNSNSNFYHYKKSQHFHENQNEQKRYASPTKNYIIKKFQSDAEKQAYYQNLYESQQKTRRKLKSSNPSSPHNKQQEQSLQNSRHLSIRNRNKNMFLPVSTTNEQKKRWKWQMQSMMDRRRKISNILKLRHFGHCRYYTQANNVVADSTLSNMSNSKQTSKQNTIYLKKKYSQEQQQQYIQKWRQKQRQKQNQLKQKQRQRQEKFKQKFRSPSKRSNTQRIHQRLKNNNQINGLIKVTTNLSSTHHASPIVYKNGNHIKNNSNRNGKANLNKNTKESGYIKQLYSALKYYTQRNKLADKNKAENTRNSRNNLGSRHNFSNNADNGRNNNIIRINKNNDKKNNNTYGNSRSPKSSTQSIFNKNKGIYNNNTNINGNSKEYYHINSKYNNNNSKQCIVGSAINNSANNISTDVNNVSKDSPDIVKSNTTVINPNKSRIGNSLYNKFKQTVTKQPNSNKNQVILNISQNKNKHKAHIQPKSTPHLQQKQKDQQEANQSLTHKLINNANSSYLNQIKTTKHKFLKNEQSKDNQEQSSTTHNQQNTSGNCVNMKQISSHNTNVNAQDQKNVSIQNQNKNYYNNNNIYNSYKLARLANSQQQSSAFLKYEHIEYGNNNPTNHLNPPTLTSTVTNKPPIVSISKIREKSKQIQRQRQQVIQKQLQKFKSKQLQQKSKQKCIMDSNVSNGYARRTKEYIVQINNFTSRKAT